VDLWIKWVHEDVGSLEVLRKVERHLLEKWKLARGCEYRRAARAILRASKEIQSAIYQLEEDMEHYLEQCRDVCMEMCTGGDCRKCWVRELATDVCNLVGAEVSEYVGKVWEG